MYISPLSIKTLENIQEYHRDQNIDKPSLLDRGILSWIVLPMMKRMKRFLAPRFIMMILLMVFIILFMLITIDSYDNFSYELSFMTCLIQLIVYIIYAIIQNIITAQFNYNQSTTTVSDNSIQSITYYDHMIKRACEIFIMILISISLHHFMLLGNEGIFSFMVYFAYIEIYALIYQEYLFEDHRKVWAFTRAINKEFLILFTMIPMIISNFWDINWIFFISEWIVLIMFISNIIFVSHSLVYITYKKGKKTLLYLLKDWVMLYNVIIVPILFLFYNEDFYSDYLLLIITTISLLFARNAIGLQFAIYFKQKLSYDHDLIIINILLSSTIFFTNHLISLIIFTIVSIILATQIIGLLVIRSIEITHYLQVSFCSCHPLLIL